MLDVQQSVLLRQQEEAVVRQLLTPISGPTGKTSFSRPAPLANTASARGRDWKMLYILPQAWGNAEN